LPTDDALVFLHHVDASLLVVEEGKSRAPEVQRALELLKDYRPIGTVLNKSRSPSGRYDYL
jgi:Mrp family chromosome partitioning ATPase